jgi:hypothetical protein
MLMVRLIASDVSDMDDLFGAGDDVEDEAASGTRPNHRFAAAQVSVSCRRAVLCHCWERAILIQMQVSKLGFANPCRVRQYCVENWLKLGRRARDDPEHF